MRIDTGRAIRVLLVEDEILNSRLITRGLNLIDPSYVILGASNGVEALEVLARDPVDVVITDIRMPEMTGLELLGLIRDRGCDVECIVLTGYSDFDSALEALHKGAFQYLKKPVSHRDLDMAIKQAHRRVVLERKLVESEERFRTMFTHAPTGIAMIGLGGPGEYTVLDANPSFMAMLGLSRDSVIGRPINDFVCSEDHRGLHARLEQIKRSGDVEFRMQHRFLGRGAHLIWSETTGAGVFDDHGRMTYAVLHTLDITAQKRKDLYRKRLETAIDGVDDLIMITGMDGSILYMNSAFERITGYSPEEVRRQENRFFTEEANSENRFCETMRTAIKDGKSWKGTFLKSNKRGRELLLDATMTPVKDDNGVGNSLVFIARDVTERRRVEEKAKQIEKINALKTLTAGIAHEFSNALWIINGNVELMEGKAACKGIDKNVERIYKAVGRARTLVAQLRTFLEPDELEAKPLEIGLLVKEMVKQAAASAPRGVRVTYEIDTASCTVSIAPEYIQEIFKQIYSNALEALDGEEGHIHVELTIPTEDNEAGEPRSVRFTVSDDGCGMGRSDLEKVFDPFFSGKKDKEGLGLSMVHGIVKGAGGNISLYSTPGEGTTARVFLPIHYCRPSADPGGSGEKSACEGTPVSQSKAGNILVIDDDATICAMFKEVLEDRGYRVTCFSDSAEGFKQIQGNFALYDLLITDYHMPGIDGKSILSYVRGRNSRYPVILCSGDGLMKMNPPRADDKTGYLVKPVSKYEVLSLTEILLA